VRRAPRFLLLAASLLAGCLAGALAGAQAGAPQEPELLLPAEVIRGTVLSGAVVLQGESSSAGGRLQRMELSLTGDRGEIAATQGFALTADREVWYLLLGVPSTLAPGDYLLVVSGFASERGGVPRFVERQELRVLPREYRSERIPFDESLTDLVVVPDPRKEEEQEELTGLMGSFHPEARFHSGAFILPVKPKRRSSYFGDRRVYDYADGGSSQSVHNGVDLAAPEGTPVWACGSGRVALASYRIMTGNTIVIEHLPGLYSLYFHLRELSVQEGERVLQGQQIGTVGMTGLATGPHLHWEVRAGGVAVDPESLLGQPLVDKGLLLHILNERATQERR
jgi:hypothetical protein